MNITKVISHSGLCSRRDAKKLVTEGYVKVNGEIVRSPTTKISLEDDVVVKGKKIDVEDEIKLWLFHKPTGYLTTNKDPQNRPTIFDILPQGMPRVITIGRLDMNSEGLLLLTNNGDLARYFELPKNEISRKYHVRVFGYIDTRKLESLKSGCIIEGVRYRKIIVDVLQQSKSNAWLEVELVEGKNREIRKVLSSLGLKISRLKRVEYGSYQLGNLKKGEILQVKIDKKNYENYIRQT